MKLASNSNAAYPSRLKKNLNPAKHFFFLFFSNYISMMALAPATPQPSKSSSNYRSTRVIEELQETWDSLQKDLITTKAQVNAPFICKSQDSPPSSQLTSSSVCLYNHHHDKLSSTISGKPRRTMNSKARTLSNPTKNAELISRS